MFTIQHGTTSTKAPTHRKMIDFSKQNISKFKKKIKNTTWDKFYAISHAQDAYKVNLQTILIIVFKSASQIKTSILITRIKLLGLVTT